MKGTMTAALVFEPTPGTDVRTAAEEVVRLRRDSEGLVMLWFNCFFIQVTDSTTPEYIVDKYYECNPTGEH